MNRAQRRSAARSKKNKTKLGLSLLTATSMVAGSSLVSASANGLVTCNVDTLAALQDAASISDDEMVFDNCDIINVTSNISFDAADEPVIIDHEVTIQGNVTIDGNYSGNIFVVSFGDIILDDPMTAMSNLEELETIDSSSPYFSPSAQVAMNGIIEIDIPTITFRGLNIVEGGIPFEDAADGLMGGLVNGEVGGAILIANDNSDPLEVVIDGVNFQANRALYGGAIANFGNTTIEFSGQPSSFVDNSALIGGAIFDFAYGHFDVQNATVFDGNQALLGGVAGNFFIFGEGSLLSTSNGASFINNRALNGGAFFWPSIYISESYFANNQATTDFELLEYLGGLELAPGDLPFFADVFEEIPQNGGAITTFSAGFAEGQLNVVNSTFFNNHADDEGGAIWGLSNLGAVVALSTFVDNTAAPTGEETPGQSIYAASRFNLFGNIFAGSNSDLPQIGIGDAPIGSFSDLGGNLSTAGLDVGYLNHQSSQIVTYAALELDAQPSADPSYPNSAPVIPITSRSAAADLIDLEQLAPGGLITLNLSEGATTTFSLPMVDQRGASREGKYDAGAFEVGIKRLETVVVKKVILPAAPKRVSAKNESRKGIKVEWSKPVSAGTGKILSYEVYRNGYKIATVPGNKLNYFDPKSGLELSQSYTYRIVTVATQGKSVKSNPTSSIFPRR